MKHCLAPLSRVSGALSEGVQCGDEGATHHTKKRSILDHRSLALKVLVKGGSTPGERTIEMSEWGTIAEKD